MLLGSELGVGACVVVWGLAFPSDFGDFGF